MGIFSKWMNKKEKIVEKVVEVDKIIEVLVHDDKMRDLVIKEIKEICGDDLLKYTYNKPLENMQNSKMLSLLIMLNRNKRSKNE